MTESRLDPDALWVIRDTILLAGNRAEVAKYAGKAGLTAVPRTQEVDVSRRPMRVVAPENEEHGSFQDEAIPMARLAEPVEEALQAVSGQQELEILAAIPGQSQ